MEEKEVGVEAETEPEVKLGSSYPVQCDPYSHVPTEGAALTAAIKEQVEFYFSKQNVSSDAFLVSQMNAQRFVPISVVVTVCMLCSSVDNF